MPIKRGEFDLYSKLLIYEVYRIEIQILFWGGNLINLLQVEQHFRCDVCVETYQLDEFFEACIQLLKAA